jgi:hypothetical protein
LDKYYFPGQEGSNKFYDEDILNEILERKEEIIYHKRGTLPLGDDRRYYIMLEKIDKKYKLYTRNPIKIYGLLEKIRIDWIEYFPAQNYRKFEKPLRKRELQRKKIRLKEKGNLIKKSSKNSSVNKGKEADTKITNGKNPRLNTNS